MAVPNHQWEGAPRVDAERLPPGHLVTTRSTRILTADAAAAAILQRDVGQLLQKPFAALVDLDDRRELRERVVGLAAAGSADDWQFRVRAPGDRIIGLRATVRVENAGKDAEAEEQLCWALVLDPATSAPEKVGTDGTAIDMAQELRQLAHELNQPLAAIVTYVRGTQMRMDSGTLSDADLRSALEVVVREALRATKIVRDLDRKWGSS